MFPDALEGGTTKWPSTSGGDDFEAPGPRFEIANPSLEITEFPTETGNNIRSCCPLFKRHPGLSRERVKLLTFRCSRWALQVTWASCFYFKTLVNVILWILKAAMSEATVASSTLNKSLQRVAGSILVSNPKGLLCKCRIQPPPLPPPPPFNHTGVRGNKGRKGTSPVVGGLNQMKGNEILVCVCVEEGEEVVNVSIQKSAETHKQSRNCASNS